MRPNSPPRAAAGEPRTPDQAKGGAGTAVAEAEPPRAAANAPTPRNGLLSALVDFFTSMRLTVACLALGLVLVFAGTLAQVDLGPVQGPKRVLSQFPGLLGTQGGGLEDSGAARGILGGRGVTVQLDRFAPAPIHADAPKSGDLDGAFRAHPFVDGSAADGPALARELAPLAGRPDEKLFGSRTPGGTRGHRRHRSGHGQGGGPSRKAC